MFGNSHVGSVWYGGRLEDAHAGLRFEKIHGKEGSVEKLILYYSACRYQCDYLAAKYTLGANGDSVSFSAECKWQWRIFAHAHFTNQSVVLSKRCK